MWFIETPVFSELLYGLLSDDDYSALQRDPAADVIYLLFLYPKSQQEDLTPDQLKRLKDIVQEDLK